MRQRPRLRRVLKWGGTLTCLLIALAFVASMFNMIQWTSEFDDYRYCQLGDITFSHGALSIWLESGQSTSTLPPEAGRSRGWTFMAILDSQIDTWYTYEATTTAGILEISLSIPLWMPFVLAFIPTAYLWYRDCPPTPGHCEKCGYDLTGNESGRCPECGGAVTKMEYAGCTASRQVQEVVIMCKPRLHWFSRGALTLVAIACLVLVVHTHSAAMAKSLDRRLYPEVGFRTSAIITSMVFLYLPTALVTLVTYGLLTRLFGPKRRDIKPLSPKGGSGMTGDESVRCAECETAIRQSPSGPIPSSPAGCDTVPSAPPPPHEPR
jgi:hypothetical protein